MKLNKNDFLAKNSKVIQSLLESLSAAHNVWIKFVSCTGDYIYTPKEKLQGNYCRLIRSHPEGFCRCKASAIKSVFLEPNRPHLFTCHAGLIILAVPLLCGEELLGSLATGEIRTKDTQSERNDMLRRLFDLNLNENQLLKFYNEVPIKKEDEVIRLGQLISAISSCFLNLGMAIGESQKIEIERALIESELKALNSQINPHFLFNTLNAIQMISYLEDADQTSKIINALAKLLRAKLDTSTYFTTLREELEVIQNLIYIQKTRFEDRLQATIFIPEELLDLQLPRLSLQPLVENAFLHGLEPLDGTGKLELRAFVQHGDAVILIKDNGCGMNSAELAKIRDGLDSKQIEDIKGIGLVNINQRCKALFGNDYGIEIDSEKNGGTEVYLRIPIRDKGCELDEDFAR